jgi:hypothetical protein
LQAGEHRCSSTHSNGSNGSSMNITQAICEQMSTMQFVSYKVTGVVDEAWVCEHTHQETAVTAVAFSMAYQMAFQTGCEVCDCMVTRLSAVASSCDLHGCRS